MDRADWEAPEILRPPCTCRLLQGVTMVWWLRRLTFDQNTRSCKEAVNWTSEGIMLSRVPPSCINVV
jgi:hypothetical protein